ncbi:MAG: hypothetical protein SNJ58_03960 [Aggregatilineales bacterium]
MRLAWQLGRLGLGALGALGAALSILLALGAADPPRHHRRFAELEALAGSLQLPGASFTLIASGMWRADASPLDSWHLILADADERPQFTLTIHGDASFSLAPLQPDSVGFIHLRQPPASNEIWLYVTPSEAMLYLNRELAWRGRLSPSVYVQLDGAAALRNAALRIYIP